MKPLAFGAALRLGLTQAVNASGGTSLVFLTRAAEGMLGPFLAAGIAVAAGGRLFPLLLAGAGLVVLASALLRGLALSAAIRQGRMRLLGREADTLIGEGRAIAHRAPPFLVLWVGLDVFQRAFTWAALWGGAAAYLSGVLPGSALLALALLLVPLLAVAVQLWAELAFVRSMRRDEPATVSLFETAGQLSRRLGAPLGLWLLTAGLSVAWAGSVSGVAGSLANPWAPGAPVLLAVLTQGLAGAVAATLPSFLEVARLQAYLALDLDLTGELPRPAPAPDALPSGAVGRLVAEPLRQP